MPVIEPMMSMAYALSGGIDLSSGPERHREGGHDRGHHGHGQDEDRVVGVGGILGGSVRPNQISPLPPWTSTLSWLTVTMSDDRQQQQREGDERPAGAAATQQDAQADAQEAGHQQEVAEEADVADLGRAPSG